MQPVSQFTPPDIVARFFMGEDVKAIKKYEEVSKSWAETIRGNNQLWQFLIRKDFKIAPGKYISLCFSKEEYKFLFQHEQKLFAKGGKKVGQVYTSDKNKHGFTQMSVDSQGRIFFGGSSDIRKTNDLPNKKSFDNFRQGRSEFPQLPGVWKSSRSQNTLMRFGNSHLLLNPLRNPITTINTDEYISSFEVLDENIIIIDLLRKIKCLDLNGKFIRCIAEQYDFIDFFSIQLPNGEPALLTHRSCSNTDTNPQIILFNLLGEELSTTCFDELSKNTINYINKIDENRFLAVVKENSPQKAFIFNLNGELILLSSNVKWATIDDGRIYILEDNKTAEPPKRSIRKPAEPSKRLIHVWDADGQYFGKILLKTDHINVFDGKIYSRRNNCHIVKVRDVGVLPKEDSKTWHLDLNNFKLLPENKKNQIYGIFYTLIQSSLKEGEDYFGCAEHAFEGIHCFEGRFDDSLRQKAIISHLDLNKLTRADVIEKTDRAIRRFDRLPESVKRSLEWGIWVFEGMPLGNANFGAEFFHKHPTHSTVHKSIQYFRNNGLPILSYELRQELRKVKETLNSPALTQETAMECLALMSPPARAILQKCAEVLENAPHSSEAYNGSADSLTRAINNLVDKL